MTQATTASQADVQFHQVSKRFGQATAVDQVSFTVNKGELVTLLGPSGCGKTTTLRMIAGLDMPSDGQITIGGEDVTATPPHQRDVAMVFQSYALFPHMNVGENVNYGLKMSGIDKASSQTRVDNALAQVGLTGYENRLPSELSGGQQQRVAVARALVVEPKVLLFDEPLSNLDAKLRRHMRSEIRQLQQRLGLTVVYVTHDQEEAMAVSDQIIVMKQGRIAQQGTPMQLYHEPSNAFVANFIGDANVLDTTIVSKDERRATVALGEYTLSLPHRELALGPAKVALRPYGLRLSEDQTGLAATVTDVAFLGSHTEYNVETDFGPLFVIDHSGAEPPALHAQVYLKATEQAAALVAAEQA